MPPSIRLGSVGVGSQPALLESGLSCAELGHAEHPGEK